MDSAVAIPFNEGNLLKPVRVTPKTPSRDAVRKQLSIILRSRGLLHAVRVVRFLKFVVEETLAGRSSQLCEYTGSELLVPQCRNRVHSRCPPRWNVARQ
jgi:hypothetical protein